MRRSKGLLPWLFLAPALLLLAAFTLYPIVVGTGLSLFEYNLLQPAKYVGDENFQRLVHDRFFITALKNSFTYLLVVPVIQLVAIMVAVGLNQSFRSRAFFRAALYVPVIMSSVVVGLTWRWILDQRGLLNYFLIHAGLLEKPIAWLANPRYAMIAVMMVTIWKGVGYYAVIYLAALQAHPPEYSESAMVDGAGSGRIFWSITIPLLRPAILFASTLSLVAALKVFEEIYVLTGGGPLFSTTTMMLFIFERAFGDLKLGYAAAAGVILAVVIGIFSALNFRIFWKGGYESHE